MRKTLPVSIGKTDPNGDWDKIITFNVRVPNNIWMQEWIDAHKTTEKVMDDITENGVTITKEVDKPIDFAKGQRPEHNAMIMTWFDGGSVSELVDKIWHKDETKLTKEEFTEWLLERDSHYIRLIYGTSEKKFQDGLYAISLDNRNCGG